MTEPKMTEERAREIINSGTGKVRYMTFEIAYSMGFLEGLEQREKISEKENQVHLEMIYRLQDELKQEREKNDEQYKSFQEWKKVYFEKSKKLVEALEEIKNREQYSCECVGGDDGECSCDFTVMQFIAEQALAEFKGEQK